MNRRRAKKRTTVRLQRAMLFAVAVTTTGVELTVFGRRGHVSLSVQQARGLAELLSPTLPMIEQHLVDSIRRRGPLSRAVEERAQPSWRRQA